MRAVALLLALFVSVAAFAADAGKVLGELGQAIQRAEIRRSASAGSRVFHRTQRFEYLIVRRTANNAWLGVVMSNGTIGYIKSAAVAVLPYTVRSQAAPAPSRSGSATPAGALAQYALNFTGTRYVWGGNSLTNGIDCSGFVQQLFGKIGVGMPRTAAQQALVGTPITRMEDLQPGDRLYFWEKRRNKIGHTGIYLGNAYFVHSSSSRRGVATDDLRDPKWRNILVAARR